MSPDVLSVSVPAAVAPEGHRGPIVRRAVAVAVVAGGLTLGATACGNPCNDRGSIPGQC